MLQGRSESLTVHPPPLGPWAARFTTVSLWVAGVLMERLRDLGQTKAWCWGLCCGSLGTVQICAWHGACSSQGTPKLV